MTRTELRIDKDEKGVLALNQTILSGDIIYVPEGKPRQSTLDAVARFLPGVAYLIR